MVYNIEYRQEVLRQMIFVSSILAGFAFAVIVQLLTASNKNKYIAWSMRAFIASTSSLLVATIGGAILLFASGGLTPNSTAEVIEKTDGLFGFLSIFFIIGLALFMAGIAIAGWIHSKALGIFAIIITVLSCLIMSGVYIFVAQTFAPR